MPISFDFSGRDAIVTGGASGIGRATAERLRDGGARVRVWDLAPCQIEGCVSMQLDITDRVAIAEALAEVQAAGEAPAILVNSAGVFGRSLPTADYDPDDWRRVVEINLFGTFEVCRQVAPRMAGAGYGRIVNMASIAGKAGTPNLSAYSAAKAGVIAFTKALGKEFAGTEVRVNCLAPAAVKTPLLDQVDPATVAAMVAKSPLGRLGRVEEVVAQILYLCSEECSFNVGAVFDVSGGRADH